MSTPYYRDGSATLYHGKALDVLRELPGGSVHCCVTSPPYFGLRDYGVPGQLGAEPSPAEYVEAMRAVFAEVHRVLQDDGTLWLNLGDCYYSGRGASTGVDAKQPARRGFVRALDKGGAAWARPKSLLGIPWRVAFALQDDGWTLRNHIVWNKTNAMPESVTDRLSGRHEALFLLVKGPRYWFDLDPIREPTVYPVGSPALNWSRDSKEADVPGQTSRQHRTSRSHGKAAGTNLAPTGTRHLTADERGKNPGDVWDIPTQPFTGAHFATMPPALAERCILSGCRPGGTVLDPFSGSGTTGLAAGRHGRRYVGIDLNSEYLDLSLRTRLQQPSLDLVVLA